MSPRKAAPVTLAIADGTTTRAAPVDRAALVAEVCASVASGATLLATLAAPGMPSKATFFRWLFADRALADQYRTARAFGADAMAEDIEAMADAAMTCQSMTEVNAMRLKFDALRWALSKRCPKRYSERVGVEAEGGATLTTFTLGIATA